MTQSTVGGGGAAVRRVLGLCVVFLVACSGSSSPMPEPRAALPDGDAGQAELEAKLALQANPLDAEAHFALGCLLARREQVDQAIVGFERTLAVDPTHAEALYNLGTLLLLRGETVPASGLLESAVQIRPDHVKSLVNLGKAYFLAGLPELSIAAYEEALRRDPANVAALGNLVRLTDAGGLPEKAAEYRRRLGTLEPHEAERPSPVATEPAAWSPPGTPAIATAVSATPAALAPAPGGLEDEEVRAFRELLRGLPHVTVERRADRLVIAGWTSGPAERTVLDRVLAGHADLLDLTTDDTGDPQRMLEVDATIFIVISLDSESEGFNFLRLIDLNFSYFSSDHERTGTGFAAPGTIGAVGGLTQEGWLFSAAVDYNVNIANAAALRVAVLARPHLTTLSGTPAKFLAGGELVFQVSGINSGDIKLYPFGTTLTVTPTLLRTPAVNGDPRIHLAVEAGRTSALQLLTTTEPGKPVSFDKVNVSSEAVLDLNQTLILSGLAQRESRTEESGVPILKSIPLLKYFFSTTTEVETSSAVIILLTPRDPGFWDDRNRAALDEFVAVRRAYIEARQGTEEDFRRFSERYPNWRQIAANRFASHFFLLRNSELYRTVSGADLADEDVELNLLGRD